MVEYLTFKVIKILRNFVQKNKNKLEFTSNIAFVLDIKTYAWCVNYFAWETFSFLVPIFSSRLLIIYSRLLIIYTTASISDFIYLIRCIRKENRMGRFSLGEILNIIMHVYWTRNSSRACDNYQTVTF